MSDASMPQLTRRSVVQALGAGAAVIGFDAAAGAWVTAADADTGARALTASLPWLDGSLHLDAETRNEYAQDFGRIVSEYPLAVLKPGSVDDIRRVLAFANALGIRVVGRGRGHTAFGQAQVRLGVVIDMSTLQTIHHLGVDRVEVDAGLRWTALLDATLARGLMPPALTDFIGQSVGGTLSVGGIGGMTHREGAQIDNVIELHVVTGAGELVVCSETRRRALFHAALAGQGQVGVIVRATLKLVPAPKRIRVFTLVYDNLAAMTADANVLMDDGRFEFLEGFAARRADGSWVHVLQGGRYFSPPGPEPDANALLAGLRDLRSAISVQDHDFRAYANRVPNFPAQPHPWIDLILPYPAIDDFVSRVEQVLVPLVPGDRFSILLIPMRTDRFTRPLFRAPKTRHAFGFGILRFMPDGQPDAVAQAVAFNRKLFDQCRDVGGTHYPISAVQLERDDWVRHYGEQFERLAAAKARHDPRRVLAGGPDVL
jgi:cytokinin dehydrogenase